MPGRQLSRLGNLFEHKGIYVTADNPQSDILAMVTQMETDTVAPIIDAGLRISAYHPYASKVKICPEKGIG